MNVADGGILDKVLDEVRAVCRHTLEIRTEDSLEHDLRIRGYDAEDLIDALTSKFGLWVRDWPWHRFLNLNEPPRTGAELFRFLLPRKWWPSAFPGLRDYRRLTPVHIAKVLQAGHWIDP